VFFGLHCAHIRYREVPTVLLGRDIRPTSCVCVCSATAARGGPKMTEKITRNRKKKKIGGEKNVVSGVFLHYFNTFLATFWVFLSTF
jgi:hypothetical protein